MANAVSATVVAKFEEARLHAQQTGKPLVQVLADRDLLLTPERQKEIIDKYFEVLLRVLDNETAENVMRSYWGSSKPSTANDMFMALQDWLETYKAGAPAWVWGGQDGQ